MRSRNAFTLVDVMVALIVLLLGTGGILGVAEASKKALREEQERVVGNRILYRLNTLPTTVLAQADGQTYDFRGLRQGPPVYTIGVQSTREGDYVVWHFEVHWEDSSGETRRLTSQKITWGGAP